MTELKQVHEDLYLGLDIGGTKCGVVVGDASFVIKKKIFFMCLLRFRFLIFCLLTVPLRHKNSSPLQTTAHDGFLIYTS